MSWLEDQGRKVILTLLRSTGWRSEDEVLPGTILYVGQDLPARPTAEPHDAADEG